MKSRGSEENGFLKKVKAREAEKTAAERNAVAGELGQQGLLCD